MAVADIDAEMLNEETNVQVIFSGSDDTTFRMWDVETGACLNVFTGHVRSVRVTFKSWLAVPYFTHDAGSLYHGATEWAYGVKWQCRWTNTAVEHGHGTVYTGKRIECLV